MKIGSYGLAPVDVTHSSSQGLLVLKGALRQVVVLQVSPRELHGVEFWAVRRQIHHDQAAFLPAFPFLGNHLAGVYTRSVRHDDRRASRIGLPSEGLQERLGVLIGGVTMNLSVLHVPGDGVDAAHQVQARGDPARLPRRQGHWVTNTVPAVGIGLGQPDGGLIQEDQVQEPSDRPFFTTSRSSLNAAFSSGSA